MFDWWKKKDSTPTNVVKFPEKKPTWTCPPEPPPVPEKPATIFYRIGIADTNRVSLQMGHNEITMNKAGVDNLIRQLSVFRDQLIEQEDDDE